MVIVQPFRDLPQWQSVAVYERLKEIFPRVVIKSAIPLPAEAYASARQRYRADTIIKYLQNFGSADTVVVGLTGKDISTTKGGISDWGIMGLGFCPGNSCVASTYRLTKNKLNEQFYKVVLHELGHTQGLPHCQIKSCFMRDAEGGNPLDEEKNFCPSCQSFLISKGWQLN
jgi:archaemetzincin